VPVARLLEAVRVAVAKPATEKTLEELAEDMHTRADGLAHLAAAAEMERRKTRAQMRTATCTLVAAIAAAISAASAAVATGIALYLTFHGGPLS
jgi:hypothetical protein